MRVLLIDSDILVYRFALANQVAIEWDSETWTYEGDLGGAIRSIEKWEMWLQEELGAERIQHYLSDPTENWRHGVYPDYKGTRAAWQRRQASERTGGLPPKAGPQRPILYKPLREWFLTARKAYGIARLEGDDVCGIEATMPRSMSPLLGERIIVSVDKDLRTIPGLLFNPDHVHDGVQEISGADADRFHLYQTLMGDKVDGYPGCPGIGPVKANAMLDKAATWETVVAAYEKAGLTEEDALIQARVARVCRSSDYDHTTKEVKLWNP